MKKSRSYWIHRISHEAKASYPLLENGYLSIGFSDFSTPEFIEKVRSKDGEKYFHKTIKEEWGELPPGRYNLWRFIAEMKKGDIVIVPIPKAFQVFQIKGNAPLSIEELDYKLNLKQIKIDNDTYLKLRKEDGYIYYCRKISSKQKEKYIGICDLGFFWEVVPIVKEPIPRYEYADSKLTARLKIRHTNTNADDIKESIEATLKRFKDKKPISLYSSFIQKESKALLKVIRQELTPEKFEKLIKWYFLKVGATSVKLTSHSFSSRNKKSGDIDVTAEFEHLRTIIYVQAKFYTGEIDSEYPLFQLEEAIKTNEIFDDGYARILWLVTTAEKFSKEVIRKARERNIILIDGIQFASMLLESGITQTIDEVLEQ